MKTVNEIKLSFPSKSQNEAFARAAVSAFIAPLDPTVGELSDLKTAVSEAVTNCVVHGYRRQNGMITINGKITEDRRVILKIRDKGVGKRPKDDEGRALRKAKRMLEGEWAERMARYEEQEGTLAAAAATPRPTATRPSCA